MTAPDYSKCWNCERPATRDGIDGSRVVCSSYYEKDDCPGAWGQPEHVWKAIHDRLAAVRDEATRVERERSFTIADKISDELHDAGWHEGEPIAERAAELIRKGE